jgi:hypothetical protein
MTGHAARDCEQPVPDLPSAPEAAPAAPSPSPSAPEAAPAPQGLHDVVHLWATGALDARAVLDYLHSISHMSRGKINDLIRQGAVHLPDALEAELRKLPIICASCALFAGQKRHPRVQIRTGLHADKPTWTLDISGPFPTRTHDGHRWMSVCVAPGGMGFVAFHRHKSDAPALMTKYMPE